MGIAVGCLSWIVGFAILLLLEREWLQRLPALPREAAFDWPLAVLLALLTALALGSLLGLLSAGMKALHGHGAEPPDPDAPRHWQDGQRVEVNGVLEAREAPMAAPFSQRPAVYVSYGAYTRRYGTGNVDERLPPRLDGLQHVSALLRVGQHRIALQGFPGPRGVEEVQFAAEQVGAAAAAHLQRTRWQGAGVPQGGLAGALDLFTGVPPGAGAAHGRHVMNSRASDLLSGFENWRAADLQARLVQQRWTFSERVWAPGQRFTATGTWRSHPPQLDIGYSVQSAEHALQAGTVAQLSRRALLTALVFTLVFGTMAGVAHVVLAEQGGGRVAAWWKTL
jgi:hypothetical protein